MRQTFRPSYYLIFFLTALLLSWPLVLYLPTHLPIGTETAATVPLFNLWTLLWNAQSLAHGYAGYWNAPIFYPEPGTFALSDPQPLTGMFFALAYFISGNAVLAYNLVFLGFLTLNGVAGALWGEEATEWNSASDMRNPFQRIGVTTGIILTGLFAQSLPFVTREWGVLQLVAVFPVFFALIELVRFGKTPSLRAALALGGWVAVTFLISNYYGLFLLLFLPIGGVIFIRRVHFRRQAILNLLAGVALAGALLLPILPTQARLTRDYIRSDSTIKNNSAWGVDYLRLDRRMWGSGIMPWLRTEGGSGQKLYPGTGLLVLAGIGLLRGARRTPRKVIFCLLGGVLAFGISFGLNLEIAGVQPYQWIRDLVPGFEQLRSPFRSGAFVQVFLVGLASVGIEKIFRPSVLDVKDKWRQVLVILMGLVSIVEVVAFPAQVWTDPDLVNPPAWVGWLKEQPEGVVAIIPFASSGLVEDFEPTTLGMLLALTHGKPLVNGYSGFFPKSYRDLSAAMLRQFPNENSLTRLREAGVVYLIVDREWLTSDKETILLNLGAKMGIEAEKAVFVLP